MPRRMVGWYPRIFPRRVSPGASTPVTSDVDGGMYNRDKDHTLVRNRSTYGTRAPCSPNVKWV